MAELSWDTDRSLQLTGRGLRGVTTWSSTARQAARVMVGGFEGSLRRGNSVHHTPSGGPRLLQKDSKLLANHHAVKGIGGAHEIFFLPTSRKVLPTIQTFCPVGAHFAQTVVLFAHFQVQARQRGVLGWG